MTDGTAGGGRAQPSSLHSEMSWSMPDRIVVRGFDLPGELMGKVNLGDMAFLELLGRLPSEYRERREPIPGLGHPIHKPVDPRATRLFALADQHGISGQHTRLMQLVGVEAERQTDRQLPINVTGAIGAIAAELGIPWQVCRGLGLMARSIGLVAHLLEEMREPMGREIWRRVEEEASGERRETAAE